MSVHYFQLISIESLFQAWNEFRRGKSKRADVQIFERDLEDNLFKLHECLENRTYHHGGYQSFYVQDPKRRHIHKASVLDRIVHHLLYEYLYGIFDKTFIYDSYSCRLNKGTHKAVSHLEMFVRKVSKNYTKECWILKCDIKKFFANVDQKILLGLLNKKIEDGDILWLLKQVIFSFQSEQGINKGIPLGNLTSQIFANIYLNALDQFIKHKLKIKYYLRYADDFLILSTNKNDLVNDVSLLGEFLVEHLKLDLHPKKIIYRRLDWGVDFLGYIILPHYRLPRTKTKRRIFKKISKTKISYQGFQSYLGFLKHANSYRLTQKLKMSYN